MAALQENFKDLREKIIPMIALTRRVSIEELNAYISELRDIQEDENAIGHRRIAEAFLEYREKLDKILAE